MVNTCVQVEAFPQASVTVKRRVMVPPQVSPVRGPVEQLNVKGREASVAEPPAAIKALYVAGQAGKFAMH